MNRSDRKTEQSYWRKNALYCGKCHVEMETTGLGDCNGWICRKCGRTRADIASFKMYND